MNVPSSHVFPEKGRSQADVIGFIRDARTRDLKNDGTAFAFAYDAGEAARAVAREEVDPLGLAAGEAHHLDAHAERHPRGRERVEERAEEDAPVQPVADVTAGDVAVAQPEDLLAREALRAERGDGRGARHHGVVEPEAPQHGLPRGLQEDARADRGGLGDALVHGDAVPVAREEEGGGGARGPGTDDADVERALHGAGLATAHAAWPSTRGPSRVAVGVGSQPAARRAARSSSAEGR
jgi:hypothetical protein